MEPPETFYYRVTVDHHTSINEFGEIDGRWRSLNLQSLPVRLTPKGAVFLGLFRPKRFQAAEVQHRARAYAAPMKAQAFQDFYARKAYQIAMTQKRLNQAEADRDFAIQQEHFIK